MDLRVCISRERLAHRPRSEWWEQAVQMSRGLYALGVLGKRQLSNLNVLLGVKKVVAEACFPNYHLEEMSFGNAHLCAPLLATF